MAEDKDLLKADMIENINKGGAWFTTREGSYLKIGRNDTDAGMFAAAFAVNNGEIEAGAYTFGSDWFDISFHGSLIDIYVDPDTLKHWDVVYEDESGSGSRSMNLKSDDGSLENMSRIALFAKQADAELRASLPDRLPAYRIDGAGFARELTPSEAKMGRKKDIFTLVGLRKDKQ
jgi:hypothetical protein